MAKRNFPDKKKPMVEPKIEVDENVTVEPVDDKVYGKVVGCEKLNVRSKANISGEVRCVVAKGDTIDINEKKSTDEWYFVTTETGIKGFCMRKYVGLVS